MSLYHALLLHFVYPDGAAGARCDAGGRAYADAMDRFLIAAVRGLVEVDFLWLPLASLARREIFSIAEERGLRVRARFPPSCMHSWLHVCRYM